MSIEIEKLPYHDTDLEPYISSKTLFFHYQRHYINYVKTANELMDKTPFKNNTLREIILISAADTLYTKLFQNAAQVFNHNFYWKSLKPNTEIPEQLKEILTLNFGSPENFKSEFVSQALTQFGSGYVWLVADNNNKSLKIITTSNAFTPITQNNITPLCCIDVWEHAYYLDYQNSRKEYLENIVSRLLNWDFIWENYQQLL